MLYFWIVLLILLNTCWLGLVPFALPGNWLMVISACAFAWWRAEDEVFSIYTLIVIAVLALIGELAEFFAGAGGARKAGAGLLGSAAAVAGAIIGAVSGTFLLPVPLFGTVLGACLGAGLATWVVETATGKKGKESLRSSVGAGLGQFVGSTAKLVIALTIWLIIAVAAFWP